MNDAEKLLDLVRAVRFSSSLVLNASGLREDALARIKFALDFERKTELVFRAVAEDWDYHRIFKETY